FVVTAIGAPLVVSTDPLPRTCPFQARWKGSLAAALPRWESGPRAARPPARRRRRAPARPRRPRDAAWGDDAVALLPIRRSPRRRLPPRAAEGAQALRPDERDGGADEARGLRRRRPRHARHRRGRAARRRDRPAGPKSRADPGRGIARHGRRAARPRYDARLGREPPGLVE